MGTLELSNLIQLEINENLRNISIPKKGVVFGVDGDIEVNRVAFVFPRYYSNFDMTEFSARVNYVNANGEANYYEADDMSSDDGDTATFSWLMTSDVTSYIGEVRFSVLLYKQLDERYVKKFGTRPATGRVLEGLNVDSYVTPEQQLTLIEKMEKKFDAYVEAKILGVNHDIEDAKNGALDAIEEAKNDVDSFIASSKSEIDTLRSSSLDDIKNLTDTSKLNISTLTDEKLTSLDEETVRQLKNIELAGVEETEKIRTAFSSAVSDIQIEGQKQADAVDSHGDSKIKEINDSTATSLANINSISEKQIGSIQLEGTKQTSSVISEGNKQVSTITSTGATEITKVKNASSTALSDIGSTKASSISEITAKGTEQVKTIKDASAGEISKVQAAGTSQVKSVSDEGKIQIDGVKSEGEKQVQSVTAKGIQSLQDIDTAKTAAVKSINDQTKPIVDKVEQLKQNVNDKSDSVDENYEQMKKLHCIEISEEAPTNERTGLWVNPESNEEINIPEIKDEEVNDVDTWSSQKINHEIDSLKEDLSDLNDKKITKFYASNLGETHLSDSDNSKIMDMVLYGRCEQQTTTGKNLFDVAKTDNSILQASGINIVKVDRQSGLIEAAFSENYQQLGIIIPEKERDAIYTLKLHQVNDKNDKIDVRAYTIKNNMFSEYVNGVYSESNTIIFTFNITAGTQSAVWFRPAGAYNAENKNVCKFSNIQLEKGSEATSFEPYTGSQPSPSPNYPQEIKSVVNPTIKLSNGDGTESKTVTIPYTLNAIPVSSGGNVTIDGQQYVSDYVDVERGKLVMMVKKYVFTGDEDINKSSIVIEGFSSYYLSQNIIQDISGGSPKLCSHFTSKSYSSWINLAQEEFVQNPTGGGKNNLGFRIKKERLEADTVDGFRKFLKNNKIILIYKLDTPVEIDLTTEEITAFKALATYYPTTNISINSEQLDGYTVFNYPISMENGWNYVKQQLNDNRDYIYDMDLQSAEAYVNSEYAVALTELEV